MNYRVFKKQDIKVSEVSLGAEHIEFAAYDEVENIVDMAIDSGVNYTDLFMGSPDIRDSFGKLLKTRRNKMMIAGHLGAVFTEGQYKRTRDMKLVKQFYNDLLKRLGTDYIDMIMMHFIDDAEDWKICVDGGMLDYALELKKKGSARMLGISTHVPAIAKKAVETGLMDGIMFSVNPLFDLMPADSSINDLFEGKELFEADVEINTDRHRLYSLCENNGVGIIVMKAYAGGWLLNDKPPASMTTNQCISYALSKPGVVTAACGCKTAVEFAESLTYIGAGEKEKDFSSIYKESFNWKGEPLCLYCNHCLPCPAGIDIAGAMRVYDTSGVKPENCTVCGICEQRCPFGVEVSAKFT